MRRADPIVESTTSRRVWPDLLAFTIGLGAAWLLAWETGDLIWGLWLSSLLTGYMTFFVLVGSGFFLVYIMLTDPLFPPDKRVPVLVGSVIGALFFLSFFSVHFGMFHLGHAVFLQNFFPLESLPEQASPQQNFSPLSLIRLAWFLIPLYGYFLVAAIISERKRLFVDPLAFVRHLRKTRSHHEIADIRNIKDAHLFKDALIGPYRNVIRMHLLIFVFAGVHFLEIESFLLFALVYAVYFFPWHMLKKDGTKPSV